MLYHGGRQSHRKAVSAIIPLLQGKRVLLGVCGSIAAYKAVDLASKLTQAGAQVDVIMTASAQQFISPLTFQAVSGRPVHDDMWRAGSGDLPSHIRHIALAESADLLLIAPISAHTLAKLAQGFADNLLTLTALALRCPILLAPAMDAGMYEHPAVQANCARLQQRGLEIIPPAQGRFASGYSGIGRLPDTAQLLGRVRRVLGATGPLAQQKIVVSAGGTREALDPVRYIGNRSSGLQGHALAQAALDAGADVTLITCAALPTPVGAQRIAVTSAAHMQAAVLDQCRDAAALLMAAAVADYRPQSRASDKIKKSAATWQLPLVPTGDILLALKAERARTGCPRVLLGFAAESENLAENARHKLERKGLDLIFANDISASDAGFAVATNRGLLLHADGSAQELELASKEAIAAALIENVAALLAARD